MYIFMVSLPLKVYQSLISISLLVFAVVLKLVLLGLNQKRVMLPSLLLLPVVPSTKIRWRNLLRIAATGMQNPRFLYILGESSLNNHGDRKSPRPRATWDPF